MARFDLFGNFFDEIIIDAYITEFSGNCSGYCTHGQTQPGSPEEHTDQHTPECTTPGTRAH